MSCGRPNSCSYTPCRRSRCSRSGPGKPQGVTATRSLLSISLRATLAFRSVRASWTVNLPNTRMTRHVANCTKFMNMYQTLARRCFAQPTSSLYALSESLLIHSRALVPPPRRICAVRAVNAVALVAAARARRAAACEVAPAVPLSMMRTRLGGIGKGARACIRRCVIPIAPSDWLIARARACGGARVRRSHGRRRRSCVRA